MTLKEKRLEEAKALVEKYATATYLVSEESHDVKEMVNAMNHFAGHFKESMDMAYEEGYRKGWIDGTECGAVGCNGGAEYCQEHKDLY